MSLCRLCLVAIASLILLLANLEPGTVAVGSGYDKLDHAMAYAALAPLAICAFPRASFVEVFAGLMVFNTGIELSQSIAGLGRQPDILDWAVGSLTSLIVLGAVAFFRFFCAQREKR